MTLTPLDWIGFGGYVLVFLAYSWLVERSPWAKFTLSRLMTKTRRAWFEECAKREIRIPDVQIMMVQQNGAAYFGSASLLGIGAGFTVLTAAQSLTESSLLGGGQGLALKALFLMLIYALAFFQFSWAFRLFNYSAIALGAIEQISSPKALTQAQRAGAFNVVAGQHFNQAIRLFLFAIPLIFWFVSLWAMLAATFILTLIMLRRQFFTVAQLEGFTLAWQIDEKE